MATTQNAAYSMSELFQQKFENYNLDLIPDPWTLEKTSDYVETS